MNDHTKDITPQAAPADPWGPEIFPILNESDYFNHCSISPLPTPSALAVQTYAADFNRVGGAVWLKWAQSMDRTREHAATMIGATPAEIGFVANTTHGVLCIANSLAWRPGDNIVTAEHEFPANVYPWMNLRRRGVALRVVPEREDYTFSADDFLARIDERTRLVAVSLVQFSTGCRMPVERLGAICRERGILFCVDAIQGMGAMPVNVDAIGADFLMADTRKWLLGLEGFGLLYVRRSRLDLLDETMTGWLARERFMDFDDLEQPVVAEARRFEAGAPCMIGSVAAAESLGWFVRVGVENVWSRIEALNARLREGLPRIGYTVVSPAGDGQRSGIVACHKPGIDPAQTAGRLAKANIHVTTRRGWLRIAPHGYNQPGQIDRLLSALAEPETQP